MCAGWNGTIVLHCFSLGLFAATQLNFRSSTATFASTTNLQSFPLNGGGTSRVSYHWLRRFGLACESSQLLGVRRARIIFFHIAAQSASRLLNGLKECSNAQTGGLTNAPQFKRFARGGRPRLRSPGWINNVDQTWSLSNWHS